MYNVLIFIAICWASILFTQFAPIQDLIDKLYARYTIPLWFDYLIRPLSCPKCLSVYIGLIYYQNIWFALLLSLATYIIQKILKMDE